MVSKIEKCPKCGEFTLEVETLIGGNKEEHCKNNKCNYEHTTRKK